MFRGTVLRAFAAIVLLVGVGKAAPLERDIVPTVTLDKGTFVGLNEGTVYKYLGIPFAQPPVGDLRFNLPVANSPYNGTHSAIALGAACPQQAVSLPIGTGLVADAVAFIVNSIFQIVTGSEEDCLTINVVVPSTATSTSKLPVVAWIFGGGFELGSPGMYDGGVIVERSIELGEPIIYVSMNYRVSAFGFLASQEVKDAGVGNLGLQDQRLALKWIQKYISAFGGDPDKVTIWGESAGAISVAMHMLTNGGDTEGLFRGAFMESGSPIPVGDITHGQAVYDAIVDETGCTGASDTLQCLRELPYTTLKAAVDKSPNIFSFQSLNLAYLPRVDGNFLTDDPQKLVQSGSVADIPFVNGDCDDEGTLFTLVLLNITTEQEVRDYVVQNYVPEISDSDLDTLLTLYPADPTQGSPFDTGILNALTPQFKRLAAMQGDLVFQAPRRFFLQQRSAKQKIWSFLSKRLKALPALGALHASDILDIYGTGEMRDYLVHFVNNLDPNGDTGTTFNWPQYTNDSPQLLTFLDDLTTPLQITQDNYRVDGMQLLTQLSLAEPL
ncbi:carotenoid ester lipase precursor [Punctularia strigosozonata HHB-11173 SS5]|uniref:carotenoid ester lipase precursor n=1 Tax=Punctularia strigosozonata (strain HHB-11173) TaxID=741275 RepID=UPI0004417140|nr:carotenoid ester lipase precursor [Punctularia strigosozonata HHB-11173 SS5]EIN12169.1 carotenoid ester lipase precursor [Punctularia strigosozonata HHB-11173 SS5]